ncbi:hypothetical protein WDU94_007062, partial [Cyamophila willieti]
MALVHSKTCPNYTIPGIPRKIKTPKMPKPGWSTGLGVTSYDCHLTHPEKYLVGTLNGYVMYGEREPYQNFSDTSTEEEEQEEQEQEEEESDPAKERLKEELENIMEEEIAHMMEGDRNRNLFVGPVRCLERNEDHQDIILTCGDFNFKIIHQKLVFSPIMSFPNQPSMVTYATWNYANGACVHVTREDGYIDLWNLNLNIKTPVNVLRVCNDRLLCARTRQEGDLVALGADTGDLHLVRYSHAVYLTDEEDDALFDE